ncbi:probable sulfate transporter 3.3 isoform X3 [Phoenix dactylifera]|uniref:Probable sulfate transporter 3.3 isoform X3 n=1 Tax=Phoenix dactylifera TaxID=42345 RepID=A0A8B8IZF1_PHODC|nr:probable sulfate transporter 3.3 isoform X3 [Phoenix dactylifera]
MEGAHGANGNMGGTQEDYQVEIAVVEVMHKVVSPPPRSSLDKIKVRLKETFFPDDPFRHFKGQPPKKKWILGAQYLFPILGWAPTYNLSLFKSDVVSGLTIATLAIPQGISYAQLANLPPIIGLYSSFVPPLVYSILGSSRDLAVGPVSIASLIMGSMLRQAANPKTDPYLFLQLAFTSTFFAGIVQASLGIFRLGFIIDFLSKATLTGFMAGAAIIVSLQQLKSMLGIVHFTKQMGLVPVMSSVFHKTDEWSWQTILMGICFLAMLLLARHVEGVAVGRTFASLKDYKVDGNKEMMAIGLMNIVGSCTSCYVTTGAFSRSAVNHQAGCKTALSNIVMSMTVMFTLLFLMPLFVYTPNVVLGAIIIAAVIGLIDVPAAYYLWKMDKIDFIVCLCAFLGVLFVSVQDGLAIAVGISIFRILLQTTRPNIVILGNITGTDIYRNLQHYNDARRVPGFLILAVEAPINFTNTTYLNERITRCIEEEEDVEDNEAGLRFVILDLSAVSTIDTSGVSFLVDLKKSMEKHGLELVLINPMGEVMEKLQRANGVHNFYGVDSLYLTIGEAIISLSALQKESA